MTTVAAIADAGHVYMAADSRNNVYQRPVIGGARKIANLSTPSGEQVVLGVCGAGCLANVLPAKLSIEALPASGDSDHQQWANAVAQAITEIAYDMRITNERGNLDGTLLLGASGRLWTLTDYQAIPHTDGLAAVGSGEEIAMGALHALRPDVDPATAVRRAVEIACLLDDYTAEPIITIKI